MARIKGKTYERDVANRFRSVDPDARRGYQYRDGDHAPDVVNKWFFVECKCQKRPNIYAAFEQAEATKAETDPRRSIVFAKKSGKQELVAMEADTFFMLLQAAIKGMGGSENEPEL